MAPNPLAAPVAATRAVLEGPALIERAWQKAQEMIQDAQMSLEEVVNRTVDSTTALNTAVDTIREVLEQLAPTLQNFETATHELTRAADEVHQTNEHIERMLTLLSPIERAQRRGEQVAQRLAGAVESVTPARRPRVPRPGNPKADPAKG